MKSKKRKIHFGQNLKFLREQRKLLQADLARMLEVRPSTISGYENGQTSPAFFSFLKLVDIFGVNADDFIYKDLTSGSQRKSKPSKDQGTKNEKEIKPDYSSEFVTKEEMDLLRNEFMELSTNEKGLVKMMNDFKNDLFGLKKDVGDLRKNLGLKKRTSKK